MLRQQGDPRIHFAIRLRVIGADPCLRNEAYRPEHGGATTGRRPEALCSTIQASLRYGSRNRTFYFAARFFSGTKADFTDEHTSLALPSCPNLTTKLQAQSTKQKC